MNDGDYALAWDHEPDNPNPHAFTMYGDRFDTYEEAEAAGQRFHNDPDDGCLGCPYVVVRLN